MWGTNRDCVWILSFYSLDEYSPDNERRYLSTYDNAEKYMKKNWQSILGKYTDVSTDYILCEDDYMLWSVFVRAADGTYATSGYSFSISCRDIEDEVR
jgi:hypothetical protein